MCQSTHLTIGDIAEFYGEPGWKIRRIVDALPDDIPRAGRYRLIPRELLPKIGVVLDIRSKREAAQCS